MPRGPGNLIRNLALPTGSVITNHFDSIGRLFETKLRNSSGSILNSHVYAYDRAHPGTNHIRTAGDYVNYTYDDIGQLKTAYVLRTFFWSYFRRNWDRMAVEGLAGLVS